MEDYRRYRMGKGELFWNMGLYAILDGVVSYLFYRSWAAFFLLLPGGVWFLRERSRELGRRKRRRLEREFLTAMQSVSTALTAGSSPERAFREALAELEKMQWEQELMVKELRIIAGGLSVNRRLEELLLEMAERTGLEDVKNFARIFAGAKRSGGNLSDILRRTIRSLYQRQEIRQEIQICLHGKKTEQNVMSTVPCLILLYVGTVSPEFLEGLYHNPAGICIMTGCLAVYFGAWLLGRRIVQIEP